MAELDKVFDKVAENSRQKMEWAKKLDKKRFLFDRLTDLSHKESHFILLLTGLRGAGKTTLCLQVGNALEMSGKRTLYIPADHVALADTRIYDLVEEGTRHGYKHFILDEIHTRPDWSKELKSIYDSLDVFALATGSSTALLKSGKYDLSRRAMEISLPVLSYREMVNLRFGQMNAPLALNEIIKDPQHLATKYPAYSIQEYLAYYSLPMSLERTPEIGMELINSTLEKIIYQDLPKSHGFEPETVQDAKRLLLFLASITPGETSISKLAQMMDATGKGTVKALLDAFADVGLIHAVPPHGNPSRRLRKSYKILLSPPFRYSLTKSRGIDPSVGALREDFFVSHISQIGTIEYIEGRGEMDYLFDGTLAFEIGGEGKTKKQSKDRKDAYLVKDVPYSETGIPLHLLGYLY